MYNQNVMDGVKYSLVECVIEFAIFNFLSFCWDFEKFVMGAQIEKVGLSGTSG